MKKTIEIPEGYKARIEGNKVLLEPKESEYEQKPSTSVAEFDAEVERFCKESFITDINEKGRVFCIARHFADWQKNRES